MGDVEAVGLLREVACVARSKLVAGRRHVRLVEASHHFVAVSGHEREALLSLCKALDVIMLDASHRPSLDRFRDKLQRLRAEPDAMALDLAQCNWIRTSARGGGVRAKLDADPFRAITSIAAEPAPCARPPPPCQRRGPLNAYTRATLS